MDNLEKIAFPTKTRRFPTMKRAETPENVEDDKKDKVKTAKSHCVNPNSAQKAMSATNARRDESCENDNYEGQRPKIKTKEFSMLLDRFKATSDRFEERMVVEDEAICSTIEGFDLTDFEPTEGCSEDAQWEIIQIPNSTKNHLPNIINFQNVLNATADELNGNQLEADSITNNARSDSRNQQDNGCFTIDNLERNDDLNNTKLDNRDLEEMDCDMNASEILMEEIENEKLQAGPSMLEENVRKLVFKGFNTNHLLHDGQTYSETQNNNFSINYEALIKRIGKTNFSRDYSNLKRCRHPNRSSYSLPIKIKRNKFNTTANKYSVTSSNKYVKSSRKEQKQLRAVVMNSMEETHPDLHFENDIAMRLQVFLWDMLYRIGDEAENLIMFSSKKVFDRRVLKYAIKLSLEKMIREIDVVGGRRK